MLGFFLDGEILGESFLFLAILLGDHDALQVLGVDHAAVDLELAEGVVNLVGGELLTPGHQRVPEPVEEEISVFGNLANQFKSGHQRVPEPVRERNISLWRRKVFGCLTNPIVRFIWPIDWEDRE